MPLPLSPLRSLTPLGAALLLLAACAPLGAIGTAPAKVGSADAAAGATLDAPAGALPFGQIAVVCGVPPRRLGTEVARSDGSGTYRLYDSDPRSTQIRPQFLTGFDDGCARQFNAALALFGTSAIHEATRYNPQNTSPYSDTDEAYERVKRRLCGVGRGKACPAGRADRMARASAFVSAYRGFGGGGDWLEMFLHDGDVAAYTTRTN